MHSSSFTVTMLVIVIATLTKMTSDGEKQVINNKNKNKMTLIDILHFAEGIASVFFLFKVGLNL